VIGSFGDVIFEVSTRRVRTFDNFARGGSGRWAEHEIINQKPVPEFTGPGLEEISFSVRLDANMGVNPESELKKLREMRDTGKVADLIIGGEPISESMWVLESLREQHKVFSGNGRIIIATAELSLKEYPLRGWERWLYTILRMI
jgi:hypothetical protein